MSLNDVVILGSIIVSFGTFTVSVYAFRQSKRELFVSTISKARISRMQSLTALLYEFFDAYLCRDTKLVRSLVYKMEINFSPFNGP